jgi:hypothetical protein
MLILIHDECDRPVPHAPKKIAVRIHPALQVDHYSPAVQEGLSKPFTQMENDK